MRRTAALCLTLLPAPALAHPHVWIDTRIEVILDDRNRATGVRIDWTYDHLYSLFVIGDLGLDPDWDGELTADEGARLAGFDMNWIPGFPGDTYALLGETPLDLSRPKDWSATYEDGKITSSHLRSFAAPVALGDLPLVVQAYDPSFYVAYAIPHPPVVTGGQGCDAQVFVPDMDAAQEALLAALAEYTPDVDIEAEFPAVGAQFAEEVRVTCPAL
jgi:polyphosphate kinase